MKLKYLSLILLGLLFGLLSCSAPIKPETSKSNPPNILLFITDDQSHDHIRALGCSFVNTPAMDRVTREGVNFSNAYVAAPQCGPSRAALLTGKYTWQIESSGVHSSVSQSKFISLPEVLEENGFHTGYTGKGAEPGWWTFGNRHQSFAGPEYNGEKLTEHYHWFYHADYFRNFKVFLSEKEKKQPFFFFMSPFEPHRDYRNGGGQLMGKKPEDAQVPPFLPDVPDIRDDLLDYGSRIDYADQHLYQAMDLLEKRGEFDNTIIIISGDNGMAFPGAKATLFDYGVHVPLAVWYGNKVKSGRTVDVPVSLVDLFPTVLDFLNIKWQPEGGFAGVSLKEMILSEKSTIDREAVFFARERHASARWMDLGYPQRGVRWNDYIYIHNFHPERWPAGSPEFIGDDGELIKFGEVDNDAFYRPYTYLPDNPYVPEEAKKQIWFKWYNTLVKTFRDIDYSPSQTYMIRHREDPDVAPLFQHCFGKNPREMLFNVSKDPGCLNNLATNTEFEAVKEKLRKKLFDHLEKTGDARVVGDNPDIYETYRSVTKPLPTIPKPDWALENKELAKHYEDLLTTPVMDDPYIEIGGEMRNDTLFYHHWVLTRDKKDISWTNKDNLLLYNLKDDPGMTTNVRKKNYYGASKLQRLAIEKISN